MKCADHKVKVIELPWASKSSHITLLFEAFAIDVLKAARSIKDARRLLHLSWWQTQEIMKAAVERGLARREGEKITFVGLDEKRFLKGMKSDAFACVMTDIDNRRVLDVARERTGKGAETLINKALDPFQANGTGEAPHILRSGSESHTDRSFSSGKGWVLHSDEPNNRIRAKFFLLEKFPVTVLFSATIRLLKCREGWMSGRRPVSLTVKGGSEHEV